MLIDSRYPHYHDFPTHLPIFPVIYPAILMIFSSIVPSIKHSASVQPIKHFGE